MFGRITIESNAVRITESGSLLTKSLHWLVPESVSLFEAP